jgi:hypothetical protein
MQKSVSGPLNFELKIFENRNHLFDYNFPRCTQQLLFLIRKIIVEIRHIFLHNLCLHKYGEFGENSNNIKVNFI